MKKVKGLQVLLSHTEAPSSTPGCHDIHLVNLSYVENVKVEESSGEPDPHSEPDSVDQVHARYIAAVAEEKRKGINVTKAAQNIFNQLHKMLVIQHSLVLNQFGVAVALIQVLLTM